MSYVTKEKIDAQRKTMTAAEVEAARIELGVTVGWMALYLDVTQRAYYNWLSGTSSSLPEHVPARVAELQAEADAKVAETFAAADGANDSVLTVYRADHQLPEEMKASGYPASWWFRIAARAAAEARRHGHRIRLQYEPVEQREAGSDSFSQLKLTMPLKAVLKEFLAHPGEELWGTQISERTGIGSGTLYPILDRLERAGLASRRTEDSLPAKEGRPLRVFWKLTEDGQAKALEVERGGALS